MNYDFEIHGPLHPTKSASEYLWRVYAVRAGVKSLAARRANGTGPAFIRQSNNDIRYPQSALDEFAERMNAQPLLVVLPVKSTGRKAKVVEEATV